MSAREVEGPAGAPWERPLHGDPRPPGDRVRRARRQPARRPRAAPAVRLPPPGRRARPPEAAPERLRDPGLHRPARHVARAPGVRADDDRAPRRDVRGRPSAPTRSSSSSTHGRSYGGSQFLNSTGTGSYLDYLCDEVVAFVDERYPTLREPRPPRPDGQVLRRLRRHGRADAAPRRVRRARLARRRRALRGLLPARVPEGRAGAARRLRRLLGRVLRARAPG